MATLEPRFGCPGVPVLLFSGNCAPQPATVPPELGDVAPRWEAGQVGLAGGAAGRPRHWELKVPFLQRTQLTLPFSFRCL